MFECSFCHRTFKTKSSCNHHKRTANYCIKLRDVSNDKPSCPDCRKTFKSSRNLQRHITRCKYSNTRTEDRLQHYQEIQNHVTEKRHLNQHVKTLEHTIRMLERNIERLERQNEHLTTRLGVIAVEGARKTTTNNNIQINAPINLTPERIQERMATLTADHLVKGLKAVVGWIKDEILVDESGELLYQCTNPKDGTFRYLDEDGQLKKDVQGRKLIAMIQQPFNEQGLKICTDMVNELIDIDRSDTEAFADASWRVQRCYETVGKLKRMCESPTFVRELGVVTSV